MGLGLFKNRFLWWILIIRTVLSPIDAIYTHECENRPTTRFMAAMQSSSCPCVKSLLEASNTHEVLKLIYWILSY